MHTLGLASWRWLLVLAAALAGLGTALAQEAGSTGNTGTTALQRFIGPDGLGLATVKRSDLEALWGTPEVEKPVTPTRRAREPVLPPWLLIQYKSRGLTFTTPSGTYGMADPPIEMAHFSKPFEGCTPQGLCIDMPQDAAMAIIAAHYTVTSDHASTFGNHGRITGRTYSARNKGWRQTHYMSFGFSEGRLYSMSFQLQPTPLVAWSTLRGLLAGVVLIGVAVGASRVLRPYRQQLEPLWQVVQAWFWLYVIASAAIGLLVLYLLFHR
ncbi:MAG: hypothetical protein KF891_21935 [Rhizobacter sp.]|nr:hypothetical protein [Rhizobacter sp.]